jgi:hypothetical protein
MVVVIQAGADHDDHHGQESVEEDVPGTAHDVAYTHETGYGRRHVPKRSAEAGLRKFTGGRRRLCRGDVAAAGDIIGQSRIGRPPPCDVIRRDRRDRLALRAASQSARGERWGPQFVAAPQAGELDAFGVDG